jgi:hypothetical protein
VVRRSRDVRRAMKGRENFKTFFSRTQTAASLWDYAEDDLVEPALARSDDDLRAVQRIAAVYEDVDYPLPMSGQRITHNHVHAFAAVAYFEGRLRPLARTRRRNGRTRPANVQPLPPDPSTGL